MTFSSFQPISQVLLMLYMKQAVIVFSFGLMAMFGAVTASAQSMEEAEALMGEGEFLAAADSGTV